MKKSLIVLPLLAFAFFVSAGVASAQTVDCVAEPGKCGNGNPGLIGMPWGLTGDQTPKVAPGALVIDETGLTDTCPAWFPKFMGCYDITRTSYYRNQMLDLGRQLKALGISGGRYGGWINLAR